MALKYEVKYTNVSKIGNLEVKFKEWTAKNEKRYLNLIEKEDKITDEMIYNILIEPCIEDKELVLSASQQRKLLIDIRIKSISPDLVDEFIPECSNKSCSSHKIDDDKITPIKVKKALKTMMKYSPSKFKNLKVKDVEFHFGEIKTNKSKSILKLEDGIINYVMNDFLLHIHKITLDGVEHENLSINELSSFVDSLPTKIFDEAFEKYQVMVDALDIEYKFNCDYCGTKNIKDYTHIPNLLWV